MFKKFSPQYSVIFLISSYLLSPFPVVFAQYSNQVVSHLGQIPKLASEQLHKISPLPIFSSCSQSFRVNRAALTTNASFSSLFLVNCSFLEKLHLCELHRVHAEATSLKCCDLGFVLEEGKVTTGLNGILPML